MCKTCNKEFTTNRSHKDTRLSEYEDFGTAQDSKGNIFDLNYRTFKWKAIYKGQPRSYKELKD